MEEIQSYINFALYEVMLPEHIKINILSLLENKYTYEQLKYWDKFNPCKIAIILANELDKEYHDILSYSLKISKKYFYKIHFVYGNNNPIEIYFNEMYKYNLCTSLYSFIEYIYFLEILKFISPKILVACLSILHDKVTLFRASRKLCVNKTMISKNLKTIKVFYMFYKL